MRTFDNITITVVTKVKKKNKIKAIFGGKR